MSKRSKGFSPDLLRDLHTEPVLKPIQGDQSFALDTNEDPITGAGVELIPLSNHEEKRLAECETIIDKGLNTFVEVGNALAEIRQRRLYRNDSKTFEQYCQQRWNLKRQRAYEIMGASEVARNLSEISDIIPLRESHAATLLRLTPEQQKETWSEIVDETKNGKSEKITAGYIKKKVDRKLSTFEHGEDTGKASLEEARQEIAKALLKDAKGMKYAISGSWLIRHNLDHVWREMRGIATSIDARYNDEISLQELIAMGIIKVIKK